MLHIAATVERTSFGLPAHPAGASPESAAPVSGGGLGNPQPLPGCPHLSRTRGGLPWPTKTDKLILMWLFLSETSTSRRRSRSEASAQKELARRMGRPVNAINEIVNQGRRLDHRSEHYRGLRGLNAGNPCTVLAKPGDRLPAHQGPDQAPPARPMKCYLGRGRSAFMSPRLVDMVRVGRWE